MSDMLELKRRLSESGILMSFNGAFTHSIIEEMGNAIKRYLEGRNIGKGAVTDVFAVYIEQTQNITNYVARRALEGGGYGTAIMVIGSGEGFYAVRSGNAIMKADVPELRSRLEEVNGLDKEGLKLLYKRRLREGPPPGASGAGLGLIDIARRSSGKLDYSFAPLDEACEFFSLGARVQGV
ncbi:MAG TPA: SiaB family protein kinase [Rectinemataceae bacterium]|nr:SiaB family protein kinase [Rectinemataceae bacterium]